MSFPVTRVTFIVVGLGGKWLNEMVVAVLTDQSEARTGAQCAPVSGLCSAVESPGSRALIY